MLVKNTQARVLSLAGLRLKPGVNDVPTDQWEKRKRIKAVAGKMERGELVEVGGASAKGGSAPARSDLKAMSVTDASKLVGETFDRELLQRWRAQDGRAGVKQAIDKQLDLLKLNDEEKASTEDNKRKG